MRKVSGRCEPLKFSNRPFNEDGMPMGGGGKRRQLFGGAVHHLPYSIDVVVHLRLAVFTDSNVN